MPTYYIYGETTDGKLETSQASYTNAVDGDGASVNTTDTFQTNQIGQGYTGSSYYVRICYFDFDTTSIPSGEAVDSWSTRFYSGTSATTQTIVIEGRVIDWGPALTTADWVLPAEFAAEPLACSVTLTTAASDANRTLTGLYNSAIVKGAHTYFVFCTDRWRAGTVPSDNETGYFIFADYGGTSFTPRLQVNTSLIPEPPNNPTIVEPSDGATVPTPVDIEITYSDPNSNAQTRVLIVREVP